MIDDSEEHLTGLATQTGGRIFLHVPITANLLDWLLVVKNGLLKDRIEGRVLDHHGDPTQFSRLRVLILNGDYEVATRAGYTVRGSVN